MPQQRVIFDIAGNRISRITKAREERIDFTQPGLICRSCDHWFVLPKA